MTRPVVIDVIGRDRTGAAMASAAASQKTLAKQIDATNKSNDNLRKSQLGLIAAQERYNKVAQNTGASVGQLATAQKSLITAQQRVSAETRKATAETEKFANASDHARAKFKPLVDSALLLGPALVPVAAGAVAAGAGLAGLGAAGVLAFKGIQREMKQGTDLGKQYQATFAPVVDEFHQLEHIAAANVFGGINKGIQESKTLFPLVNQDVALLSTRLGDIAGNVGVGLVGLFHQLNPLFLSMADFVDKGAVAFQRWATTSDGPKRFVAYAQANLPTVEHTLTNVAKAVEHLVVAAAPIGGATLQAISALATAISKIPVPILTGFLLAMQGARLTNAASGLKGIADQFEKLKGTVTGTASLGTSLGVVGVAAGLLTGGLILLGESLDKDIQAKFHAGSDAAGTFAAALRSANGAVDDNVRKTVAAQIQSLGLDKSLTKNGINLGDLTNAVLGTNQQYDQFAARLVTANVGLGKDAKALHDLHEEYRKQVDLLAALNVATLTQTNTAGMSADAIQKQAQFLAQNNLTVDQAVKKYNDANAAAHTFTAELGYMSTAFDQQSNNLITATLGQDALNLAIGTSADNFAGARKQVEEHGTTLKGNTDNAIANRGWALQQIQAINNQALAYAKSSGSIDAGTSSLKTNEGALRTSLLQAGFTRGEVQKLLDTYAATPDSIKTSISEQGSAAVLSALGDIEFQLHAIADPVWKANLDVTSGALAAQGGKPSATGGYITGPGGPTSDVIPLMASNGEYIVNARSTAKHRALLENINRNKFAGGGLVGDLNVDIQKGAWANMAAFAQSVKDAMTPVIPASGAAPGNISALQAYAYSLFPSYGWGAGALSSLIDLWNGESGWNPNAVNQSSGAWGIPQSLPADKMASAGADWRTNGATQIRWGLQYINSVYGSPTNAYSAWLSRSPHWYGQGAWNVPADQLAGLHRGEMVIPAKPAEQIRAGAGGMQVGPINIAVYAAAGMSAEQVARQTADQIRAVLDDRERRYAKGARA